MDFALMPEPDYGTVHSCEEQGFVVMTLDDWKKIQSVVSFYLGKVKAPSVETFLAMKNLTVVDYQTVKEN